MNLNETFTITSPTGNVTGTKTLAAPFSGLRVNWYCVNFGAVTVVEVGGAPAGYTADIAPATGGRFRDTGGAFVAVGGQFGGVFAGNFFEEGFISSNGVVPLSPTSKEDCKNGGYKNYVDDQGQPFKNQGQCIKYVNEHGG